jgi:iron complex outermembrane recepter protein
MRLHIYFFIFIISIEFSLAQVTGRVVDGNTLLPLQRAVVITHKDSTSTQPNGFFSLPETPDTIFISHLGYQSYRNSYQTGDSVFKLMPEILTLAEFEVGIDPFKNRLQNTTGSYFVLKAEPIKTIGENSPVSFMNSIPGVYIQQGTQNTNRITIRGIGSRTPYSTNRIKVYLGEIPLTTGDGISVIEDLDMSGIESVELLKGPSSAIYGSGLGGTVKLTSESSTYGDTYFFHSSLSSFNSNYLSGGMSKSYDRGGFSTQLSRTASEGYRENNNYQREFFRTSGYFTASKSRFDIQLIALRLNAEIPSSINNTMFTLTPEKAAPNWLAVNGRERYNKILAGITYTHYVNAQAVNKFSVSGGYTNQYEVRPFNILADNTTFLSLRESLSFTRGKFAVNAGAEWYFEKYGVAFFAINNGVEKEMINRNFQYRQYLNLFFHGQYKVTAKLLADVGFNVNYLQYNVFDTFSSDSNDVSGKYGFKPIVSPRVGINYRAKSWLNLYAAMGHGFSHPSSEETLMPEGNINSSIKPEQGFNYEAGTRLSLWQQRVWFDLAFYVIKLNNLLVTKRVDEATFYGINAGKTNHKGVEAYIKWQITKHENSVHNLSSEFSYTLGRHLFTDFIDNDNDYSGNTLPGIPFQNGFGALKYSYKNRFEVFLTTHMTGKQYLNDSNTKSYSGSTVSNIKFLYNTNFKGGLNAKLFFVINNVFDEKYASMVLVNAPSFGSVHPRYYYPALPLTLRLGVNFSLVK